MIQIMLEMLNKFRQVSINHLFLEGIIVVVLLWLLYHLFLEGIIALVLLWLLYSRRFKNEKNNNDLTSLTKEEENRILSQWKPEPLVPEVDYNDPALHVPLVEGKPGKEITVDGFKCLNFATHNYLGFVGRRDIEEEAVKCIQKFGVGSCGPRAFYGTADVHVHLEQKIAQFFGCELACLYSYGFSTIASAIPAYAKRGDIIFVDEASNFAIQKALDASRSKIKYFKHNDISHLVQLLEQQSKEDKKNPKLAQKIRRFLVVEGIYMNTGNICKLDQMIDLKHKYKLRLFIDESISFGTLGSTGKGITEHLNISIDNVDMIMANLEYGIGSIGGFCVGSSYIVEHQTLAGLGYCFSASLPPMLAAGALKAIEILENNPMIITDLRSKAELVHDNFNDLKGLKLSGDIRSPVKHLRILDYDLDLKKQKQILRNLVKKSREQGVALTMAAYLDDSEAFLPQPSIRLTCSILLEDHDVIKAGKILQNICNLIF